MILPLKEKISEIILAKFYIEISFVLPIFISPLKLVFSIKNLQTVYSF